MTAICRVVRVARMFGRQCRSGIRAREPVALRCCALRRYRARGRTGAVPLFLDTWGIGANGGVGLQPALGRPVAVDGYVRYYRQDHRCSTADNFTRKMTYCRATASSARSGCRAGSEGASVFGRADRVAFDIKVTTAYQWMRFSTRFHRIRTGKAVLVRRTCGDFRLATY